MAENYKFVNYAGAEMAELFDKVADLDVATQSKAGLMSTTDKTKLDELPAGAQVNVLEGVQLAGTDLSISEKKVNIPVDNAPTEGSSALIRSGGVAAALAAVSQFVYRVVETLPTASADTMRIIYLVPSTNPKTENIRDEFITIDNGASAETRYTWEQIGSTAVDVSGKADKDTDAVEGNLAEFDANGNPVDSGISSEKFSEIEGEVSELPVEKGTGVNSVQQKGTGAVAMSEASVAIGVATHSGTKGFRWTSWDKASLTFTLEKTLPKAISNDTWLSIVNDFRYDKCCQVDGNVSAGSTTIKVKTSPFDSKVEGDTRYDAYTIMVVDDPTIGDIDLGQTAHAEGGNTKALQMFSHAEGYGTEALGQYSHAEGRENKAVYAAHAEGRETTAMGENSHTEGYNTKAQGNQSHAEGKDTIAEGSSSHAEGSSTKATQNQAHAEGLSTEANGLASHAEGSSTKAQGNQSHAEGNSTKAQGAQSHAEGKQTTAMGDFSHTEGNNTKAQGNQSHAEGYNTIAEGSSSHAEGSSTKATKNQAHAEGLSTEANGVASHAEGNNTKAQGAQSHAEGKDTITEGSSSHAEGSSTKATQNQAHAEGLSTEAKGLASHAEGSSTKAQGNQSHAEGLSTEAKGLASHAEGYNTKATQGQAHAEGRETTASGAQSHAEGQETTAQGEASHAEGYNTKADGVSSHAEGSNTIASNSYEHAEGRYNKSNTGTRHSVGIGTGSGTNPRKNAFEIMDNGDIYVVGLGGYDGTNPSSATPINTILTGANKMVVLTQAQYDALSTKDAKTLYFIK